MVGKICKKYALHTITKIYMCLLLILIIIYFNNSNDMVYSNDLYRIKGKILNEEGNPIPDVNIMIYDNLSENEEKFVKKCSTESDGLYDIGLSIGVYKLEFYKKGYIRSSTIVECIIDKTVNLKTIILNKSIDINLDVTERLLYPGESIAVSFTVINHGESYEEMEIINKDSDNIKAIVSDEYGVIKKIMLKIDEEINLCLMINTLMNFTKNETISVIFSGNIDIQYNINILPNENVPDVIKCNYPSKIGSYGDYIDYKIDLYNPFNEKIDIIFDVINIPSILKPEIYNSNTERVSSIKLSSGDSDHTFLRIMVGDVSKKNHNFNLSIHYENVVIDVELELKIVNNNDSITLTTEYPSVSTYAGESIRFDIELYNPSEINQILNLSIIDIPSNWKLSLTNDDGVIIHSISVKPKELINIFLDLKTSVSSINNTYKFRVLANGKNVEGVLDFNVCVMGIMDLRLNVNTLYERIVIGERKNVTIKIKNLGTYEVNDLIINASTSMSNIEITSFPKMISKIRPNEEFICMCQLFVPSNVPPGDYIINMFGRSDTYITEELQLRITATSNTNILLISGIIIIVSLLVVVIFYKKYKRR